jgi:prevent-host-death family protein
MKRVNSAELRASIGNIVADIERNGQPIILEKHNQPVAVIISLKDFQERFVEKAALEARLSLADKIDTLARPSKNRASAEQILRDIRDNA